MATATQINVDPYKATTFNPNIYADQLQKADEIQKQQATVAQQVTSSPSQPSNGLITTASSPQSQVVPQQTAQYQATTQAATQPTQQTFNPATFDNATYLSNKAAQLNATQYQGKTDWTPETTAAAIKAAGLTLEDHYRQYGINEGVSPYAQPQAPPPPPVVDPAPKPDPTEKIPVGVTEPINTNTAGTSQVSLPEMGDAPTQVVQGSQDPMYWAGTINKLSAPTFEARDIQKEETVGYQLAKLLDSDSPYMESARASAAEEANSRGLLFSSLASEASQKAAIDAGAPIAAQDASTYAASALSAQNATQSAAMDKFGAQLNTVAEAQKTYSQSLLQLEKFRYEQVMQYDKFMQDLIMQKDKYASEDALKDQEAQYKSQLQKQAEEATKALEEQKAKAQYDLQMALKKIDESIDLAQIAQQDRNAYVNALAPVMQQYQTSYINIQSQADSVLNADAKRKALADLQAMFRDQISAVSSVYKYEVEWPETDTLAQTYADEKNQPEQEKPYIDQLLDLF